MNHRKKSNIEWLQNHRTGTQSWMKLCHLKLRRFFEFQACLEVTKIHCTEFSTFILSEFEGVKSTRTDAILTTLQAKLQQVKDERDSEAKKCDQIVLLYNEQVCLLNEFNLKPSTRRNFP